MSQTWGVFTIGDVGLKQLFMDPRAGSIQVADLPDPALRPGAILVRNAFSVISPGTERDTVRTGSDSYLAVARARPDLVRRVRDTIRREGILAAYRKVQSRLNELQPLGYSSAGRVLAVGPGGGDYFRVGDRVACAGAGHASHAEVVCVPTNLAARVPERVPLEAAAFSTIGAIGLHGVRQANPKLGERFAVIGLGVMGLLTVQLLRANGVRVIAFDLSPDLVERALVLGAEAAACGTTEQPVSTALTWTEGVGVDGVIVTAAAKSDAPMVAAAQMCRDRGCVTAVGRVPFTLPREIAYEKELDLKIARSYGPGRYDPRFEEKGLDYPIGYVRWTETRNLEAFLSLIAEERVNPLALVTHRFPIDDASQAYDLLLSETGPRPLGILISYGETTEAVASGRCRPESAVSSVRPAAKRLAKTDEVTVGFVGAGSFARSTLLPNLKKLPRLRLRSVVTAHGLTALDAQRRFGFERLDTDPEAVFSDPEIHLVFITTRHDLHAELLIRALQAGKHVFVEKPLALNEEQLMRIESAARTAPGLMLVGFNRRFSPHARAIREAFAMNGPLMMSYRVNAAVLPAGHWLNDPDVGGGRILGEICHFVDLMSYLTGDAGIVSMEARGTGRAHGAAEDISVLLSFAEGSIGQLLYTIHGSPLVGKEFLEVHGAGRSAILQDYQKCTLNLGRREIKAKGAGKGHLEELSAFVEAVRKGGPSPIPPEVLFRVTRTTFLLQQALRRAPGENCPCPGDSSSPV